MKKIKFLGKVRKQGYNSKIITLPIKLAKGLKIGSTYQFQITLEEI